VIGFRLLRQSGQLEETRHDFFAGMVLRPGGGARRELLQSSESLDALRKIAQQRRNTQAILEHTGDDPQQSPALAAQLADLTRGLDPDSSAQILFQLGQRYSASGQWPVAAEMFQLLTGRHPAHPLARPSMVWLVQYFASSEAAWRVEGTQRVTVRQMATQTGNSVDATQGPGDPAVRQASVLALDFPAVENRLERAADLGEHLTTTDPGLSAEPNVSFALAAADRKRGFPGDAQRFYMIRARSPVRDAWWTCARGEQWLAKPEGIPPKPILQCARAQSKPRLDGQLDDAVWQHAQPAELRIHPQSASRTRGSTPAPDDPLWFAQVMLAYDDEFLYMAIRCREAPGATYPQSDEPRSYDANLSLRDRVDWFIDVDRDFTTHYRLTVDHRGWTGDACCGDRTWNPTWFVAAASTNATWIAEAALPLDQITGQYPSARSVWAVGIQRTIPGVGFQSWSTPAAVDVIPEGFGYLIFQ
jgi:hypothetical protein